MPTYDFECQKCDKSFTLTLSVSEYEKKGFRCPECKSTNLKQIQPLLYIFNGSWPAPSSGKSLLTLQSVGACTHDDRREKTVF
jgi:putative FmdB family regulatory protein